MTTTSAISAAIDVFVTDQNTRRGGTLQGSGTLPLDYNALTGSVPSGGNAVTGVAGIAAGVAPLTLPTGRNGNTVIIDGAISTSASSSGADNYSLTVDAEGDATLIDNNTGNSQTVTGANYFVFDGGAKTAGGAYQSIYIVETGTAATLAAMYNAAFLRVPDLPGLESFIDQYGTTVMPDLDTAARYFLTSPEFAKDYPTLTAPADEGGSNDTAFVTQLYSGILHRSANASEIAFYDSVLAGTFTDSTGHTLAAVSRATVFQYFTASPENLADISAINGGWLINPAKGAVNLGVLSVTAANTLMAAEVASGTVNTADFANMPSTDEAGAAGVGIHGANYKNEIAPDVDVTIPNITINLSPQYYYCDIQASNITVNGSTSGGIVIDIMNISAVVAGNGEIFSAVSGSATINLFGNNNWIFLEGYNTVSATSIVHGWNSTDVISGLNSSVPGNANSFASLVAINSSTVYQDNPNNPINGAALGAQNSGTWFTDHVIAINVGPIANDSIATLVAAANQQYKVADIGTVNQPDSETAFFFGQDPQGNTMVVFWDGDSTHSGKVQAVDITGAVELVGVQASSLTSANFHH